MGMFLRRGEAPHRTRLGDLEVGSTVKINVNGTPREFLVVHQGLPSSLYDESCDGTWLLMKDLYTGYFAWNSSSRNNRYASSTINSYLNGTFLELLDSDIKSAVKDAKIPYVAGTGGSAVASGANGLQCKVFLLGGYEVGWTNSNNSSFPADGAKLNYFENGSSAAANNKRIALRNGSGGSWWIRSPYSGSQQAFYVSKTGGYDYGYTDNTIGIRPAFILPSDFILTDDMLAA